MTATGALIARHVTDLFPTQTSRFDLAQAARRGVISPLRCIRIPPGPGVRTIAKVPLRRGEVDTEFDQDMLAELLDQLPFNLAIADLYKTRFNGVPGVVYTAGVRHAYNVAQAFRDVGMRAQAVSGETPKRELARILAEYERGTIDVLINAQLLAEGWNSPRATVCMHLAPTASKRIYQQRVGRVTRRHPGKEAGIVIDFVHPATKHDDPVVTLHSLLDRDVYRGGAIVVGPVRRGRGRRVRVERRVLPVTPDPERRAEVFERELWRIAVEHLDYAEQHVWAALAGARVAPNGWRRAKAMLHFDRQGDLKRRFLITAVERNRNAQLRLRALQEIAAARDAEAFDEAIDLMATWPRDERREGVKIMLQALAEKRIGRRDQANAWIWRMAEYTREVHEEYAVQRWPETKRLLGLLVNSSGGAHARNARRLVHAARRQDRRLSAALLAAALAHTPEAEEALRGARTRMARKPSALARELLRNFPRGRRGRGSRRRRKGAKEGAAAEGVAAVAAGGGRRAGAGAWTTGSTTAPRRRSPRRRTTRRSTRTTRSPGRRCRARVAHDVEDVVAEALAHDGDATGGRSSSSRRRRGAGRRRASSAAAANGAVSDANGSGDSSDAEAALELVPAARRQRRRPEEDAPRADAERRREPPLPTLATPTPDERQLGPAAAEVDLAGVEQQLLAGRVGRPHAQPAVVGDAERGAAAAVPRDLAAGERVARAVGVDRVRRRRGEPVREALQQQREHRLQLRPARSRARSRASRSSGGNASSSTATLRPIPSTTQPSCGRPSARIPATLRPSSSTSLGHLIAARAAGGVEAVRHVRDGERREHRQQPRRLAQHERARERPPRRRHPRAPLPPVPGRLPGGRHERPVRRPADREPLRAHVRRVDRAQVEAGSAEHPQAGHAPAASATSAASRPSMSCWVGFERGARGRAARSASLVTGPIETRRACVSSAPPAALSRFVTVEAEVKVT